MLERVGRDAPQSLCSTGLLIAGAIAIIGLAYFFTPLSRTTLFWAAFVLTRPFGATMGDLLTNTPAMGGLGFGTIGSTLVLLAISVVLIAITMRRERSLSTLPRLSEGRTE